MRKPSKCSAFIQFNWLHWTNGAFGYFPSYTLSAMYAAQLWPIRKHFRGMRERRTNHITMV
ncbi:hypothetical protein [Shewanella glacialipiscicola]|uniref:hypothetical protein n=1 Tax=Shewanella glacialipiscicola TaxID=614069 RepID=UPI003D78CB50